MIRTVRCMTDSTFADGCRSMQKCKPFCNFMAGCAKSSDGFFRNEEFVITAMRIMALHAITRFQGLMDNLLGSLLQMAVLTKVSTFPVELKGVLLRIERFMTRSAVAEADGTVNVCFFAVISMTFFCNARLLLRSWFFRCQPGGN